MAHLTCCVSKIVIFPDRKSSNVIMCPQEATRKITPCGIVWLKTCESKFIADFVLKTDRPTDQQTELVEEAPSRSLKRLWINLLVEILLPSENHCPRIHRSGLKHQDEEEDKDEL